MPAFSSTEIQANSVEGLDHHPKGKRGLGRPFSESQERFEATKRKIAHFQEIRRERPIFQRNDHIVGDDLLLVSAVDEADAFSAVGVELLHILKYICLNAIAVRKICKKHDRLLMNRMLGGYYHRKRTARAQEEATLGGLIAHVAGDIYEAHPDLIGLVNHGKLVGVYDLKIQQLANSRTVKVVSSCLALALSEYEVSRTRADALSKLNPSYKDAKKSSSLESNFPALPNQAGHEDSESGSSGPPSTTSSLSLSRLRYTVLSIAALREASRIKVNHFSNYLSRATLSFTGHAVIGEGLDGCSRESLEVLLSFNPDSALLLDPTVIYEGLKCGRWRQISMADVMTSSLAVALTLSTTGPTTTPLKMSRKEIHNKEIFVANALGILPPGMEEIESKSLLDRASLLLSIFTTTSRFTDFPPALLRANCWSTFLYNANYFMAHPTSVRLSLGADAKIAYSALVIGVPTLSAIVSAIVHCYFLSGYPTGRKRNSENFRQFLLMLLLSATAAISGNIVNAYGFKNTSVEISILGRFIMGFSAAEVLHRQFIISFVPLNLIVTESSRLVQFQVSGQVFGLAVGSLADLFAGVSLSNPIGPMRVGNLFMASLWTIYLLHLLFGWWQLKKLEALKVEMGETEPDIVDDEVDAQEDSSDSSSSERGTGPARLFHKYSGIEENREADHDFLVSNIPSKGDRKGMEDDNAHRKRRLRLKTYAKRIRKLMSYNIAIPISLAMIVYTMFSQEVLFSSCTLITNRYFHWGGNVAGTLLCSLAVMMLPVDYICEQIARRYEERTIVKRGIMLLGVGLLVMVNWGSLFALIPNVRILFEEDRLERHHQYDWLLGVAQYVIGFIITFVALRSLEVSSRSLLSKVSPPSVNHYWNYNYLSVLVTFVGLFSQLFADCQITMVVLSHRVINTDIVNALIFPILIACSLAYYFVRKHYFFLM